MTVSVSLDRATFAAERRGVLERADAQFEPLVRSGLAGYDRDEEWYSGIRDAALALWDATRQEEYPDPSPVADAMREEFAALLSEVLAQTTEPSDPPTDAEVNRLAEWLGTFTVNSATMAAAAADGGEATLEWVSMRDTSVRASHREADGQVVPVGGTFDVDGYELHHPGEPVGPPAVWINCRCVVRPGIRGEFSMGNEVTAAVIADEDADIDPIEDVEAEGLVDPDDLSAFTEDDWDALEFEVPWHGVLAPVEVMSGDRRKFKAQTLTYRDLPIPLEFQPAEADAHNGAVNAGRIDRIWEEDGLIKGEGMIRADSPIGEEVITLVANKYLTGFSVHLDSAVAEMENEDGTPFTDFDNIDAQPVATVVQGRISSSTIVSVAAFAESYIALGTWDEAVATETSDEFTPIERCLPCEATELVEKVNPEHAAALYAQYGDDLGQYDREYEAPDGTKYRFDNESLQVYAPGTRDGPGWVTNPRDTQRLRTYWVRGKGAAKIRWGQPGDFNRCRKQLAKYVKPNYLAGTCANLHKEAIKVWPGQEGGGRHALAASAAPAFALVASAGDVVPSSWFGDPLLDGPTPITIEDDGRVYGHIATWSTCHLGSNGYCQTAPHSETGYSWFHSGGTVLTDDGPIRVGNLVMDTGHAPLKAGARGAASHYDNTGEAVAQVRVGEDDHGIWFAGVVAPHVTPEQRYRFRAAALSGDWRKIGGSMELIGALAVNVPGFPIPATTYSVENSEQVALVASGVVLPREAPPEPTLTDAIRAALSQIKAEEAREKQAAELKASLRSRRAAALKASLRQ